MLASQRAPAFSGDYRTSRARISSILLALQILRRGRIPRRHPHQRALQIRQHQLQLRHRSKGSPRARFQCRRPRPTSPT